MFLTDPARFNRDLLDSYGAEGDCMLVVLASRFDPRTPSRWRPWRGR